MANLDGIQVFYERDEMIYELTTDLPLIKALHAKCIKWRMRESGARKEIPEHTISVRKWRERVCRVVLEQ